MKHKRYGFTLVEITLFLAVSGLLFVGIMVGTQNSIRTQRYNDSVQSFANFWRDIYASVSNTQSPLGGGGGRSEDAIYGKLIVFGEEEDLSGNAYEGQKVFYYDVTGQVPSSTQKISNNTLTALEEVNANVLFVAEEDGSKAVEFAGFADSYTPTWGATIEKPGSPRSNFTGSILVVKHPMSTSISTYYYGNTIEVNELIGTQNVQKAASLLTDVIENFIPADIDFCINSNDIGWDWSKRRDVRLIEGANNTSGIEIISDSDNNRCTHSETGT